MIPLHRDAQFEAPKTAATPCLVVSGCALVGGDSSILTTGEPLPSHLKRTLAPKPPAFADPVSQRLAHLLQLHPKIAADYPGINLKRIDSVERRKMLQVIHKRLGLHPA